MAKINPGNRLYLYQLLSRELGVGRQTLLPRVEEVLEADGLRVEDLGCATMRELCEQLGEFVKLTVFKKGYVYATVVANEEYDRAIEASTRGSEEKASGNKPWKRRRGAKALKPVKPRHVEKVEAAEAVVAEKKASAEKDRGPEGEDAQVGGSGPKTEAEAILATGPEVDSAIGSEGEAVTEPAAEPEVAAELTSAAVDAEALKPSISLTITYVPEPEKPVESVAETKPVIPPLPATPAAPPKPDLPRDFHADVRCPSEQLSALYQVLPPEVDPLGTLEEDFRVARSTGAVEGTRSCVSFPLRYLRSDGSSPVRVSLRRSARPVAGKRWTLVEVDAGEPSEVGLEGLAAASSGPWSAFLSRETSRRDPGRIFAQTVDLGSWDDALNGLASLAAPENWGSDLGVLRGYLTMTFCRVNAVDGIAVSSDGSFADFDTNLLTESGEPIYANLRRIAGSDIPWALDGFSTHGLGKPVDFTAEPALRTFDPTIPCPELPSQRALKRNPRMATAAYDPVANEVRLLVPKGDSALALAVAKRGYEVVASLRISDAYVCARVTGTEQPSWLARGLA